MVARLLRVGTAAVLKWWICIEATAIPEPTIFRNLLVLALDKTWHFIQKETEKPDERIIVAVILPCSGFEGIVTMQPSDLSWTIWICTVKRSSQTVGNSTTAYYSRRIAFLLENS
ncbi:MAG: hypothetical protein ACRESZ_01695 [Methylococcales bacterium]